jgi:hypothetical protein
MGEGRGAHHRIEPIAAKARESGRSALIPQREKRSIF